jgi:hypothetical protein
MTTRSPEALPSTKVLYEVDVTWAQVLDRGMRGGLRQTGVLHDLTYGNVRRRTSSLDKCDGQAQDLQFRFT